MQCNIDSKGKLVRLVVGFVFAALGGALLLLDRSGGGGGGGGPWLAFLGLTLVGAGLVGILEGWAGWCVVRGLGFRTRI
jgi:hypothetical protein